MKVNDAYYEKLVKESENQMCPFVSVIPKIYML